MEKKENIDWKTRVQKQTKWSDIIIKALKSEEEANIYIKAGLKEKVIGGRIALIQPNINPNMEVPEWYIKEYGGESWRGWTNKDLVGEGYAPFESPHKVGTEDGTDRYELHHIGQHINSPLAELTYDQHHSHGNFSILHKFDESEISRDDFEKERVEYWMARYNTL